MSVSIIIPVLNERQAIERCLAELQELRACGHELIVVDGGSVDGSLDLAHPHCDKAISAQSGRAAQMHAGAVQAQGDLLLFLHVDTRLPDNAKDLLLALPRSEQDFVWGRFDVQLSGECFMFRMIETLMNVRSRFSGIATGDQAMFIERRGYFELGGFPQIALMEDIAMSKILKRKANPVCLRERVVTSSRRWEEHGILRVVLKMWVLRALYFLGVDPKRLADWYG
ncbi:MAG: TIGR04283 family arsenosugar biosynthesis glycosyltransferase [Candidatus Eutrophobiaceae bacterium]